MNDNPIGDAALPPVQSSGKRAFLGLFERRERWSLSGRGWLGLLLIVASLALLAFWGVQPFLAPTRRIGSNCLVVEGWVHRDAIRAAAAEFKTQGYQYLLTTGGPVQGYGPSTNIYTAASWGARRLQEAGIPKSLIQIVSSSAHDRDRTYTGAVAVRSWLRENHPEIHKIDILTEGVHARRTRLLFQKAFGSSMEVGIISIPNSEYPPDRWWRYSEGVKEVVSEGAAYLYARFFFHPDN